METSKLNELADHSTQKNDGPTHYITANQVLRDDVCQFMNTKFDLILNEVATLKNELYTVKHDLLDCKNKLAESNTREKCLLEKLTAVEKLVATDVPRSTDNSKYGFYIVGSSLLGEVKDANVTNGVVKAIRGGKVSDMKKNIQEIKNNPRNIVTQIGGNDLDDDKVTVENVSSEY